MEHEVFVPVPVPTLLRTLGDPARVARCVPGFQQDADASASPLAGRLKLRAGGHTITYRGELRLTGPGDGDGPDGPRLSVTGTGAEARGDGAVEVALTLALTAKDGGTMLTYSGTAEGDGRLAELEDGAALAAAHRLLDRFTQQLVTESLAERGEGEAEVKAEEDAGRDAEAGAGDAGRDAGAEDAGTDAGAEDAGTDTGAGSTGTDADADGAGTDDAGGDRDRVGEGPDDAPRSVYDSPVPPPSLDPVAGVEFTVPDEPTAEAAHARRTMIGRSAEEVDHAPPRGRYAPVPSMDTGGTNTTLRWVAPAAALALASAVVLGRALRRRR
ncbi:carbon monoxide dehydrogenase [Streptomyces californicus]|uniref:Carbon monoxide dehydrogenase n=1 Tax=Streptomyces californicus TaxID=67351 RepID=A0ABD7D0N4_9ACTN|nr:MULTISPECIES: SRPBCC domain-containing protein [Streptomyces]QRV28588.1 carbon monoxide dehydrogenase [Streptomyces californicus]QRV35733.1 carbon monoxide dehydrogenase [Streptomyces californicus]QRV41987.1 carbon monoxide dehydrogenase [Streptomyces californicus]QRV48755.1 carbon monoxide dehydrogenase [Streptomyces californicus]